MNPRRLSTPFLSILTLSATLLAMPASAQAAAEPGDARAIVVEDVSRAPFDDTLRVLKDQLAAEGWNLVAEINLGRNLAKRNVEIPGGLVILELTSGGDTIPLLRDESTRYISALMPCTVSVYGTSDGRVMISRINAHSLSAMLEPRAAEAMRRSAARLDASVERALARLPK